MSMGGPGYQRRNAQAHARHGGCLRAGAACRLRGGLGRRRCRLLLDTASTNIGNWSLRPDAEHMEKAFLFGGSPRPAESTAAMLIRAGWGQVLTIFFPAPTIFLRPWPPRGKWRLKADPAQLVDKLENGTNHATNIKKWTDGARRSGAVDALAGFFQKRSFQLTSKESGCADRE